ncbi:MAG: hypothetical protein KBD21_03605 [Candidatus Pacebacteria bacterium]|nr:hypothetical protein [Candidatus Paceibacterota bacterium]
MVDFFVTIFWALIALAGWFLLGQENPVGFVMAIVGTLFVMMEIIVLAVNILGTLGKWLGLNKD